jgi:hypothetical protein
MILRFRATLPPNASEARPSDSPAIYRRQTRVSGYTHVLRIAPLSDAVQQVLDHLYGALIDVGVGCQAQKPRSLRTR